MLVQCPNCDTKYHLDETLLSREGSRVRCIRCEHVFFVAPSPEDGGEQNVDDAKYEWIREMGETGAADVKNDVAEASTSEESSNRRELDGVQEAENSGDSNSKVLLYVVAAIFATTIALAAFLYSQQISELFRSWFPSSDIQPQAQQRAALGPDEAQLISLQNIRQYFVTNEKIGQLFVIEGKARNDFPTPMELIKIEASLFDAQDNVLEQKVFLAGNTVSLFQLQILAEQELEAALQAKAGVLTNNTNLRPGMDVSFMVVFANPPETVEEYGLKVIEAQHPPQ